MAPAWRYLAESLRGASHEAEGSPCQDSSRVELIGGGGDACLVSCVADGAGSSKHSDEGSEIACRTIAEMVSAHHAEHGGCGDLIRDDVVAWLNAARERIEQAADERGCGVREFATTLLAVVATPTQSHFLQVGDGAIILGSGGVYGVAFWPQSGEYANSTNFLTGDRFEEHLEFVSSTAPFDRFALLTDGLERLALAFDKQTPHTPFCDPLFAGLRSSDDLEQLGRDLRGFLASESVASRSDDDKSLVLATREARR